MRRMLLNRLQSDSAKREPLPVILPEPQREPRTSLLTDSRSAPARAAKAHARARRKRRVRHPWVSFLGGCIVALLCLELAFHNFSGKSESTSGTEQRDYREGTAKSHFLPNGLRITGNPQIPGAPTVLLLGDSHIEAFQVGDKQTMGSDLERRLRANDKPWNVDQYGWSGADGPDYVFEASLVREQFHPSSIFLLMTYGDVASTTSEGARLVEKEGQVVGEPVHPGGIPGRPPSYGGKLSTKLKESAVLYASLVHFHLQIWPRITGGKGEQPSPDAHGAETSQQTADTIVLGLKDSYGASLHILYAPNQPFSADSPAEPQEAAVLQACRTYGIDCRSLRARMIQDLTVNHKIDRGFANTLPGEGHLNARGHQVAADEIYDWLNSTP